MSQFHGPITERGKARSSQNAIRHGLTGRIVVLPTEDMEVYKAFSKELVDSLNPETPLERQLAQTVADTQWRLNRARTYEDGMLALGHDPEIHPALRDAKVFRDSSKAFVNLSLYEQRLSRQQKEALRQLRELQAERKAAAPPVKEDSKPLTQAIAAAAVSDGFVYSNGQTCALDGQACQSPFMGDTALSSPVSEQRREAVASEFVCSNGQAYALDGQALSPQIPNQRSEALVGEYDPGAFDPAFFKRSIPVRFIEKEAA